MIVPWQEIPPETLDNLIEEFVTRDGTDYGEQEIRTDTKVAQVREQLRRGDHSTVAERCCHSGSSLTGTCWSPPPVRHCGTPCRRHAAPRVACPEAATIDPWATGRQRRGSGARRHMQQRGQR